MTFEALLALWQKTRQPTTGQLIEDIGAKIPVTLPALPTKAKGEAVRAWLAAVREEPPSHLTARLTQLLAFSRGTAVHVVWPVIEALEDFPPDPRLATFAVDALLAVNGGAFERTSKLLRRLINCLVAHGDARHFARFEGVEPRTLFWDDGLIDRITRVVTKGAEPATGEPIPAAERTALLDRDWKPGEAKKRSDPLADVYAEPDDLGRRQVLADVLLEQGDPRGEFISLQLANATPKKQATLLKKHRTAWLGRLSGLVELNDPAPVFEQGFLTDCALKELKLQQFMLTLDAPEWATVKRVRRNLQRLGPTMRSLRNAGLISANTITHWTQQGFKLPNLKRAAFTEEPQIVAEALQNAPNALTEVSLRGWNYEPSRALRDGVGKLLRASSLEQVRLSAGSPDVMARVLRELTFNWVPSTIKVLELADSGHVLRLEREGEGWHLTLFDGFSGLKHYVWKDLLFVVRGLTLHSAKMCFDGTEVRSREPLEEVLRERLGELTPTWHFEVPLPAW